MVNNDSLPNIEALEAVDRVVAVTSALQPGLYDDSTYDTLGIAHRLSTEKNATGGSIVSLESILGAEPDLVIAPENAVDRTALAASRHRAVLPQRLLRQPRPRIERTRHLRQRLERGAHPRRPAGRERPGREGHRVGRVECQRIRTGCRHRRGPVRLVRAAACSRPTAARAWSRRSSPPPASPTSTPTPPSGSSTRTSRTSSPATRHDRAALLQRRPAGDHRRFLSAPGVAGLGCGEGQPGRGAAVPYTDPPSMLSIAGTRPAERAVRHAGMIERRADRAGRRPRAARRGLLRARRPARSPASSGRTAAARPPCCGPWCAPPRWRPDGSTLDGHDLRIGPGAGSRSGWPRSANAVEPDPSLSVVDEVALGGLAGAGRAARRRRRASITRGRRPRRGERRHAPRQPRHPVRRRAAAGRAGPGTRARRRPRAAG